LANDGAYAADSVPVLGSVWAFLRAPSIRVSPDESFLAIRSRVAGESGEPTDTTWEAITLFKTDGTFMRQYKTSWVFLASGNFEPIFSRFSISPNSMQIAVISSFEENY